MSDIIQLLPDSVASQIAAGEVIQRPASAVKELMENAVDAGSARIRLYLKEAGKVLIQVVDDGIGMSEMDARLCFERHATSKIRSVNDLFTLHTMGFRGEALASVAAIAQVELRSRRSQDATGTEVIIEGSEVMSQQPCACSAGTSISIKNLFYNVPARRNFLKSNPVETRHIVEEFTRIALAHPHVSFTMVHNDAAVFDLRGGNLRQRIAAIFGTIYNERLVPVEEETSIVKIQGYVGKPEYAKKVRGEQYFFVNNRFVKDGYLNHAVTAAFESLIAHDCFPSFFIKIEIDPARIDVNIHPTKTEIKFDDEKSVYAIMRAAVKRALGKFNIAPAIDFEQERSFDIPLEKMDERPHQPVIRVTPGYNPFHSGAEKQQQNDFKGYRDRVDQWHQVQIDLNRVAPAPALSFDAHLPESAFVQLQLQYILVNASTAFLVDQQRAHERVLYESFIRALENNAPVTQQQLFPQPLEFTSNESSVLKEMMPELKGMGFDISEFGVNTFVLQGAPEEVAVGAEKKLLMELIEQFMNQRDILKLSPRENIARSLAKQLTVKKGKQLTQPEMQDLMRRLSACEQPRLTPGGQTIVTVLTPERLSALFNEAEQERQVLRKFNS